MTSAIDSVNEILFYCSPLADEWLATAGPSCCPTAATCGSTRYRLDARCGPGAGTRAWCVYELVKTLAQKCKLYVVLSRADVDGFRNLLLERFSEIAKILASIDARDAQISKIDDRAYILGEVEKIDGGLGEVTKTVCAALRDWLAAEAKALVEGMPAGDEGRPLLLNNIGGLLKDQGKYDEAEPLYREALKVIVRRLATAIRPTLTCDGRATSAICCSINNLGIRASMTRRSRCIVRRCRRSVRRSATATRIPSSRSTTSAGICC